MAKSYLRLCTKRPLRDGTYPVQVAVGYGTDLYLSTGVAVKKDCWDERTALYSGKNSKRVNDALTAILMRTSARVLELKESGMFDALTKTQLKGMLTDSSARLPKKTDTTLGEMFRQVISTKNARTAEIYRTTYDKLLKFADIDHITFGQITKMWLLEFYASMGSLAVNTKSIHMRNLRNVVNFAVDEGVTTFYAFRTFRIPNEETAKRNLPITKMREFLRCEGLSTFDEEYRDMFLLMFYLIGINISDLSTLTSDNIVDGRLEYRRHKTGKLYSIKLEPEAKTIIDKYRGKDHLLRCFDRYADYRGYAQRLNLALRGIGPLVYDASGKVRMHPNHTPMMVPIETKVTTYWARYSWATYAAELDIPRDTISEALGHQYGSPVTGIYIKFSRDKVDAANRRVIDYLMRA